MTNTGLKVCKNCSTEKPIEDFYAITVKRGHYVWRGALTKCKVCVLALQKGRIQKPRPGYHNKYQRNRRETNKQLLNALKSKPCADCGVQYPPYVMDFDHLKDKSFVISLMKNLSVAKLMAEAAKCDVVCSNCHRIRTHVRKQY